MANLSRVLYENNLVENVASVSYSGTEIDGFNKENLYDYKDFSTFKPQVSATTTMDFTLNGNATINSIGVYVAKVGAGGLDLNLYYESSPSTYTLLEAMTNIDGELSFNEFSQVTVSSGRKIRLEFVSSSSQYEIRQIFVGPIMTLQRGQYVGVNPQTLIQGIIQSNNISENGAILGTNVKRVAVNSSIDLQYCTEAWIRLDWDLFVQRASVGKSFFYQWNPTDYPLEVVFCVASKINPPKNTSPTPLMSVSMPIICRQADL